MTRAIVISKYAQKNLALACQEHSDDEFIEAPWHIEQ